MAPKTFDYFFDLPPELREHILSYICVFPSGILVGGGVDGRSIALPLSASGAGSSNIPRTVVTRHATATNRAISDSDEEDDEEDSADPPLNLFLASPILYRDAGDLYYGRNVFHFDLAAFSWGKRQRGRMRHLFSTATSTTAGSAGDPSWHGLENGHAGGLGMGIDPFMRLLTHPDTAPARRRIRSAAVDMRRLGGLVTDVLVPALGDMVLNGALRRLRVDVLDVGRGKGNANVGAGGLVLQTFVRQVDYAGNPALRALLALLADPDMERAELRVPRGAHAPFWCRFHQRGGAVSGGGGMVSCAMSAGAAVGGQDGRGGDEGFMEVDIHRLVDACAGDAAEFRIKKVDLR